MPQQPDPYGVPPTSAPPTSAQPAYGQPAYGQPAYPPPPPTGAFGQPTGQFPPPTGQFPTGPMAAPPTSAIPGMAPPMSGPPMSGPPYPGAPGYPMYPPVAPPKKSRGLLITLIIVGVLVVLGGGGGAAAYFVMKNNQGTGAPTAADAVNSFLTAVYKNKSTDEALKYVCSTSRNKEKLTARIDEIRKYDAGLTGATYTWPAPTVEKQESDEATLTTTVKVTTSDEKVAETKYRYITTHGDGWWVCEITAA
ncbi:hypothetical protein [Dactylosporangium sp. NPDC051541]|uniref:Rv0361 family membrane protein n=1 Tax=Dactylosporangium sp. NPDC051541 TaxID=3363977 RepID=UPI0037AD66C6